MGFGPDGAVIGLEPWDTEVVAVRPAATVADPCSEVFEVAANGRHLRAHSSHAVGSVHQPLRVVWEAMTDPEVGHDPTTTETCLVVEPRIATECVDGDFDVLFQTQWQAMYDAFGADARVCWRFGVVDGTLEAPLHAAARWAKVWGTTAITVLEGSMLAFPLEGRPDITVVEYQYHLDAVLSAHATIESRLRVIYDWLLDRAHGRRY